MATKLTPDERVAEFILIQYQQAARSSLPTDGVPSSHPPRQHLSKCCDAAVTYEGSDGSYGCDTGCEYARLEAVIVCPHGERDEYTYGWFGELADIIDEITWEVIPDA